jgi:hypothetical protein
VVTAHGPNTLTFARFDPRRGIFSRLHRIEYPYGETGFDSANVSFYVRGQFGDAVFDLCRAVTDTAGRLWVTDFLSGKVFILEHFLHN